MRENTIDSSTTHENPSDESQKIPRPLLNNSSSLKALLITLALIFLVVLTIFLIAYLTSSKVPLEAYSSEKLEERSLVEVSRILKIRQNQSIVGTIEWNFDFKSHKNYQKFASLDCGRIGTSDRIQGGERADLFEFPWQVAMFVERSINGSEVEYFCGGSLVSEKLILTAGHCVVAGYGRKVIIRLGEYNMSTSPDCSRNHCADPIQEFTSTDFEVLLHPGYDHTKMTNDIALVKLKKPANLTQNNIHPICLPFEVKEVPIGSFVSGFGESDVEGETSHSKILMKGRVQKISNEKCKEIYKFDGNRPLTENQFCAGKKNKNGSYTDTCKGDSGGPLQSLSKRKVTKRVKAHKMVEMPLIAAVSEFDNDQNNGPDYDDHSNLTKISLEEIQKIEDLIFDSTLNLTEISTVNSTNSKPYLGNSPNASLDLIQNTEKLVEEERSHLFGIVSYGEFKECGKGERPGIYTLVYPYLKWVLDNSD